MTQPYLTSAPVAGRRRHLARAAGACLLALLGLAGLQAVGPATTPASSASTAASGRERLCIDQGWKFALGHPVDPAKDFRHGTSHFSGLAKTGNGDGPAASGFNDSAWQDINLPHDWAVGLDFDPKGSLSHGYKALGRNFPQNNIGWYRHRFDIPAADLGRRISLEFDGIYRQARIWVNGHYLGEHDSGYLGFASNISEFLNYGGSNLVVLRVDASQEEGWFYEGAGIYRHAWLVKTAPLHAEAEYTLVRTSLSGIRPPVPGQSGWQADSARIVARVGVRLDAPGSLEFDLAARLTDPAGRVVGEARPLPARHIDGFVPASWELVIEAKNPQLWDLDNPLLHNLEISLTSQGRLRDRLVLPLGLRQSAFDPQLGYFLNGRRVQLKGVNQHQDHAGVGVALPDALEDYRLRVLKGFGCNAIRTSHNPPSPALLEACDRLGLLVMPENRLMGTGTDQLRDLERLIRRDRHHPSVILWSLGNEEWAVEGNAKGVRIATTLQALANSLDPDRPCTAGLSGGWDNGVGQVLQVIGYNYIGHGNIDRHHALFPGQAGLGTEETTTQQTRGIWFDGTDGWLAPRLKGDSGGNIEYGWRFYAQRPFLAGLFWWTGFDYRGEPTPFNWPAVSSQFGIVDSCGFPKDSWWYLKSWWTGEPVLHINQHWNWAGKEGQPIPVTVNSNCQEVELFLDGTSLGRQTMEPNGHLEWSVPWAPGTLEARGRLADGRVLVDTVRTAGAPARVVLEPDRTSIKADGADLVVVNLRLEDSGGTFAATADTLLRFSLDGPGRILGVGNGNPVSHEPDFLPDTVTLRNQELKNWRWQLALPGEAASLATGLPADLARWKGFRAGSAQGPLGPGQTGVFRTSFQAGDSELAQDRLVLRFGTIDEAGWIYLNGQLVGESHDWAASPEFDLRPWVREGENQLAVVVSNQVGSGGIANGAGISLPPEVQPARWQRQAFNGRAQVLVQSTGRAGTLVLQVQADGLAGQSLRIEARP